jgi:hypothetical protein
MKLGVMTSNISKEILSFLTAVTMKRNVFSDVTLFSLIGVSEENTVSIFVSKTSKGYVAGLVTWHRCILH